MTFLSSYLVRRLAFMLLVAASALAQTPTKISISGRVLDDSTSVPIHKADVFIAHTTLGAGTDENGRFTITHIDPGSYEIVISRVGYSLRSLRIAVLDTPTTELRIRLKPAPIQLGEVVVSAADPEEWRKQLKIFATMFLGKSKNAQDCRILNPEVLDFKTEEGSGFSATARSALHVENLALGYHVKLFLTQFEIQPPDFRATVWVSAATALRYEFFPEYTELKPASSEELARWKKNRMRAYEGSLRHYLSSLVKRQLHKDGFVVYSIPHLGGVMQEKLDPATPFVQWPGRTWDPSRALATEDTFLADGPDSQEKTVAFKGFMEVEYTRATVEHEYDLLVKKGTDVQVSWLKLLRDAISVNSRGLIREPFATLSYGYWSWHRLADMVPLDYNPDE